MGRYAIILVFAASFALLTYSQGLKNAYLSSQFQVVNHLESVQAQNIAQSAAIMKVEEINNGDKSSVSSFTEWAEMEGEYKIDVVESGDTIFVSSYGRFDGTEYPVTVKLVTSDQTWAPNLSHAVFAGTSIEMTGSAKITGDVGTNATNAGAVNMAWSTLIDGNLTVGPGSDPEEVWQIPEWKDPASSVHGMVSSSSQEQVFELPPFKDFPGHNDPLDPITMESDSKDYYTASELNSYIPSINISGGWDLTIDTEGQDIVLHVGDFNIQQGFINFVGGGKVTLLVEDDFVFGGGSTFNNNGESEITTYYKGNGSQTCSIDGGNLPCVNLGGSTKFNSHLYAETANIELSGSGGLLGSIISGGDNLTVSGAANAISRVIYAPNADVEITGSGKVKGAIVADTFKSTGSGTVTFEADSEYEIPDISLQNTRPLIVYWN